MEILGIINEIASSKGLSSEAVGRIVSETLVKIAKENLGEDIDFFAQKDESTKSLRLFRRVKVAESNEQNNPNILTLEEAKSAAGTDSVAVGDELNIEITLEKLSKTAINRLFFSLNNNLQWQIEQEMLGELRESLGKIISGRVVEVDENGNTFVEIKSMRAVLPRKNRIKNESFKVGKTLRAILRRVSVGRDGIEIELSRTTPKFLEELLVLEVPEIANGDVEIIKTARIPGVRAKVSLLSHNARIDPVGACVGVKGVRINAVSAELNGESIDCMEHSSIEEIFLAKALSPASVLSVALEKRAAGAESAGGSDDGDSVDSVGSVGVAAPKPIARVTIESAQKAKLIGKDGVNIRLASMLTGYDIQIIEKDGAASAGDSLAGVDADMPKMGEDSFVANSESITDSDDLADTAESANKDSAPKLGVEALESLFKS